MKNTDIESIRRNPPRVMNLGEAAAYLGMSQRTLRTRIQEKAVPYTVLGPREFRFRLESLDRLLSATEVKPLAFSSN